MPGQLQKQGIPRPVEAALALLGLVLCAPLLAISGILVIVTSRGPMLFKQSRVGLNGTLFTLYKLRTMIRSGEGARFTPADDRRITAMGRLLRKSKIDELPELWNVLRGDMSLVGPRPEVPDYVDWENKLWRRILTARPGMTDPVTLKLRHEESLLAKVGGDREEFYLRKLMPYKLHGYLAYLHERSCWSDLRVLVRTFWAVLVPGSVPGLTPEEIVSFGTNP